MLTFSDATPKKSIDCHTNSSVKSNLHQIIKTKRTTTMTWLIKLVIICGLNGLIANGANVEVDEDPSTDLYVIEGKVFSWENAAGSSGWQLSTHIMANGGEHYGFLREDGSFLMSNVTSGSYIIEVVNPNYAYEPVRVEINQKGKFRARKVNFIQTSQVIQVPYPLKMRPVTPFKYFQVREQWRVTDFLFNPMVLMMILPLFLIMILPKIMNDPETRKEMEQLNTLTSYNMPEMSEVITSFLSGGEKQKTKAVKAAKKRQ